jgi:predicted secreted protein
MVAAADQIGKETNHGVTFITERHKVKIASMWQDNLIYTKLYENPLTDTRWKLFKLNVSNFQRCQVEVFKIKL